MKPKGSIFVKNVYYMLAYAFQSLSSKQYEQVEAEEFEYIHDLFAAILAKGIARQLKQGLYREYVIQRDELTTLRGKIDMPGTARLHVTRRQQLACEFDELSENNLFNQILKATSLVLIRQGDVNPRNRNALKKMMLFFGAVDDIDLASIPWSNIRFARNNRSYRMLISLCQLVVEGLLMTTERGAQKLLSFLDDQAMSRLYEKFILEYYVRHWPIVRPKAARIDWAVDQGERTMLPVMQSDIMLASEGKVLIIDAKYYSKNTQENYGRHTVHSAHLYQIFAYVKNKEVTDLGSEVAGMLLYARTGAEIQPNAQWRIGGNEIMVRVLDLGVEFSEIAGQLDQIVGECFGLASRHQGK